MKSLVICDCDEVLLHMVRHFAAWLDEAHGVDFAHHSGRFEGAMTRRATGELVQPAEMWRLLDQFFPAEMARQTLVPHAREALERLSRVADIVVLTNLGEHCQQARALQLAGHGIVTRVECNTGGKGSPVARLVAEHGNPVTVFVDDLPVHHESVARHAPQVHRLHMVSEPETAPNVPPAPHAHARIDDWRDAARWIEARFAQGLHATD